jgi:predicted nuclease of predicted toxin-antitoxin system
LRFFIDESLSPGLARRLNDRMIDAIHPRDVGRCGELDHVVLSRAIDEDGVIVTENKKDFQKLVSIVVLHPGLVVLPASAGSEKSWEHLTAALALIEAQPRPDDYMVNRVIEVLGDGSLGVAILPPLP